MLAALGWCWLLVGAATLGLGSRLGLIHKAPHGWSRSTSEAASALLSPLWPRRRCSGRVVFALAAVALGTVLRAGHVAVALLGVLLWSAGLEAALGLVADGGLSGRPLSDRRGGAGGRHPRVPPPPTSARRRGRRRSPGATGDSRRRAGRNGLIPLRRGGR